MQFADNSLITVPVDGNANSSKLIDYLFVSDILATGWAGVSWSKFKAGDSVAVFGAGPVGLLAAYSALIRDASQVFVVDHIPARLRIAKRFGAMPINFNQSDPVEQILAIAPIGVRRGVEAVGYEAENTSVTVDVSLTLRQLLNITAAKGGIGVIGLLPNSMSNLLLD